MEYKIQVGNKNITLEHGDLESTLNVDDLTTIDTSNIFGEAVTISAAINRIGLIKADAEALLSAIKLKTRIFESDFRLAKRKEAEDNSGKFKLPCKDNDGNDDEVEVKATEKALETCFELDLEWRKLKAEYVKCEKKLGYVSSLYWSMQDKARKLNGLVSDTVPEDFVSQLVEGIVNGVLIKKKK